MYTIDSRTWGGWVELGLAVGVASWVYSKYRLSKLVSYRTEIRSRGLLRVIDNNDSDGYLPGELLARERGEPGALGIVGDGVDARVQQHGLGPLGGDSLTDFTEPAYAVDTVERGGAPVGKVLKKIRRGGRMGFVKWWVSWGKAQFPTAWRGATAADRVCITNALTREMKAQSVRDHDIVRVKDMVVLGILTPNQWEKEAAEMEASYAVQERQQATRGLFNYWGGRGLSLGQTR